MAGVLLIGATAADARLWGRKKAQNPAAAAVPGAMTLMGVEIDGSRVVLRTSAAPAYTSYSPSPGVFVVDLTNTSRDAAATIPETTLPPAVVSISADDVVEMGSHLTRVTFRLSETMHPEVSAIEKAVVVTIPATAVAIESAPEVDVLPAVTRAAEPVVETIDVEPQVVEVVEPVAKSEDIPLPRARMLRGIAATAANGSVEVRISGDGALTYKAFRLENPSRLVIDLEGVKNAAAKNAVTVDDEVVKGVRAAQFQSAPPVARVVIDLTRKAEYRIDPIGDSLRVRFGERSGGLQSAEAASPKTVAEVAPRRAEPDRLKPVATPPPAPKAQDIPAQVPAIAENAPSWKVPIKDATASKGARRVINAPLDQAPPAQLPQTENVFEQPAIGTAPLMNAQTLTGSRTLSTGPRVFTGEPISLNLKNAELKDVLRTFAELTGLNMAIDPDVGGSVTVDFVDVPWDQALDIILRQNGLTWMLEGNVMRIGRVERIAAETAAQRRLAEEERLNVPTTTVIFPISYARAGEVAGMLRDLASPRARIIIDARTNQIIVSEIPGYLQTMQNLIRTVDVPTRQVTIEARIVESSRTFSQQWGFDWGFNGNLDPALGTGTGLVFPNRVGYRGGPFGFGVGDNVLSFTFFDVLGAFSLDLALSAAESQGYIKVVSAPRVTTQDNQAARITSGFQIPYQTRINFTTTVQYLDATLSLSVTPQITDAGTVIMDIQVQKNEPATGLSIAGAAGTPLTTRQASTRLMVRDGGTAVIAGIFQTRDNDAETRLPFVHNIPVIGALFRSHDINTSHDELLIFITPRIVRAS
ncbi:MAG TPA: type IV pilus secretin PilQ [Thermoanaerobaculia bacterium]|nr:type IV pilus secretin PilQ [Thermoanaerobaculia bacterium]